MNDLSYSQVFGGSPCKFPKCGKGCSSTFTGELGLALTVVIGIGIILYVLLFVFTVLSFRPVFIDFIEDHQRLRKSKANRKNKYGLQVVGGLALIICTVAEGVCIGTGGFIKYETKTGLGKVSFLSSQIALVCALIAATCVAVSMRRIIQGQFVIDIRESISVRNEFLLWALFLGPIIITNMIAAYLLLIEEFENVRLLRVSNSLNILASFVVAVCVEYYGRRVAKRMREATDAAIRCTPDRRGNLRELELRLTDVLRNNIFQVPALLFLLLLMIFPLLYVPPVLIFYVTVYLIVLIPICILALTNFLGRHQDKLNPISFLSSGRASRRGNEYTSQEYDLSDSSERKPCLFPETGNNDNDINLY